MTSKHNLIIIGAGPAGVFAALSAKEANPDLNILILEKGQSPLVKVKVSGGGRCNLTNARFDPQELASFYPRGRRELMGPFSRFQPADTMEWFDERGVGLKIEKDERVFPSSEKSQTVIDCLLGELEKQDIELRTGVRVEQVVRDGEGFKVLCEGGEELTTEKVLLATGGGSTKQFMLASELGHSIVPPVPSLFTFHIKDPRIVGLSGVSVPDVTLQLKDHKISSQGALLITHWGLSGPAVLSLSALGARELHDANYKMTLKADLMPKHDVEGLAEIILEKKELAAEFKISKNPPYRFLANRVWSRFLVEAEIIPYKPWKETSSRKLRKLAHNLKYAEFEITGKGEFKDEFVTCGGVELKEIDFKRFESKLVPNLFFAGEVLDIDGLTGGFNFQNAWTSGWIAGQAIASE